MCFEITEMSSRYPRYQNAENDMDDELESLGDHPEEENDHPSFLMSPARIPAYGRPPSKEGVPQNVSDDHILLEFFAGFSHLNVHRFRRFIAITPYSLKAWSKWTHVCTPPQVCLSNTEDADMYYRSIL
jgi:hypothetical protein